MRHWTRNDSIELGKLAMQAGFATVDEAREALEIGAKLQFYGFTSDEFRRAVAYLLAADRA